MIYFVVSMLFSAACATSWMRCCFGRLYGTLIEAHRKTESRSQWFHTTVGPKSCTHHLHHYQHIQHFHILLAMKPVVIWVVSCTNRRGTKRINLCINIFRELCSMVWHFITISEWSLHQIDQWIDIFWWLLWWDDGVNNECWELLVNCELIPFWTQTL